MTNLVNQHLRPFREKILVDFPNLTKDIKQYFLDADYYSIIQKKNALTREIDQLENFLSRVHSKYGCQSLDELNLAYVNYENSLKT